MDKEEGDPLPSTSGLQLKRQGAKDYTRIPKRLRETKLVEYESSSSSESDEGGVLVSEEDFDGEYALWQEDENWLLNFEELCKSQGSKGVTTDPSTLPVDQGSSMSPQNDTPVNQEPPSMEEPNNSFTFNSTMQTKILKGVLNIVSYVENVLERAQKAENDDLWVYMIETRCFIENLCIVLKIDKATFTDLDGIIDLLDKLKKKSMEERLKENKEKVSEAKEKIQKLKEVLMDVNSVHSLLREHQSPTKKVDLSPDFSSNDLHYLPYRANTVVIQPGKGTVSVPDWLVATVREANNEITEIKPYFESGIQVYFKSTSAAKQLYETLLNAERVKDERIYVGRPSRGGTENEWRDLDFMARIKVSARNFKKDWFTGEEFNEVDFLKYFFEKNTCLIKSDWIYNRKSPATGIISLYFNVALRTFDAMKKFSSKDPLDLVVYKDGGKEKALGVYNLILCLGCFKHGHLIFDCNDPKNCATCLFPKHGNSKCISHPKCPHCDQLYTEVDRHSPSQYQCRAYQQKGFMLQKIVKSYKGGY